MSDPGAILRTIVISLKPRLLKISEDESSFKETAEKWSLKEMLGHLIDSVANNHQRFVRAAFKDDLIFEGYEQDDWVGIQKYQQRAWNEIIELWAQYNLHLAHVMGNIPESVKSKKHSLHNFEKIAFRPVNPGAPGTLNFLMEDYIYHLEHHISRYIPDYIRRLPVYHNSY